MASDTRARWMLAYMSGRDWAEVPAVQAEGWGRRREPPPPLRFEWLDYWGCFMIFLSFFAFARLPESRGFLLDDEYSVVNVVALILTRIHMLVMNSSPPPTTWTALALLPTCPAPALSTPPVCYEWEKPAAAATVLQGSSGYADSNWKSHEPVGDYMAAKKCFGSLVSDAAWTCDEQEDDYRAALKCFDSLLRDAARACFVGSYDAIPLTLQSDDDPRPT